MNAAKLEKSKRLQRVHNLLRSGREFTTLDIQTKARVCAVNSIASELRAQGKVIHCQRRGDTWYYRMETAITTRLELMRVVGL